MSKPKRDAWMALYVGDYLRDTSRLSTEQHGAYLLLIMDYWVNGPLPDDDAALATIARLTPASWRRMRVVLQPFFQVKDGRWNHKRVDQERAKTFAINELRSIAGSLSAAKRRSRAATHVAAEPGDGAQQTDRPSQSPSQRIPSTESGPAREAARLMGERRPRAQSGPTPIGSAVDAMIKASLERAVR